MRVALPLLPFVVTPNPQEVHPPQQMRRFGPPAGHFLHPKKNSHFAGVRTKGTYRFPAPATKDLMGGTPSGTPQARARSSYTARSVRQTIGHNTSLKQNPAGEGWVPCLPRGCPLRRRLSRFRSKSEPGHSRVTPTCSIRSRISTASMPRCCWRHHRHAGKRTGGHSACPCKGRSGT